MQQHPAVNPLASLTPAQQQEFLMRNPRQQQQQQQAQQQSQHSAQCQQQMVPTQAHAQMAQQQQLQSLARTNLLPKESKIIRPTKQIIEQSGEMIKRMVTEFATKRRPFPLHIVPDHERQNFMQHFQRLFKVCQDMEPKLAIWHAVFQDQGSTSRIAALITMVKEQARLITSGMNQYVLSSQQVKSLLEDMEVAVLRWRSAMASLGEQASPNGGAPGQPGQGPGPGPSMQQHQAQLAQLRAQQAQQH
ncbi:hypothetical protein M422DRAFT_34937 [Sphaerobolus stellatus SS14]|uniref:Uncharacterized protein n=1 Tax=Sphaerobolus stellatus (strain SS14) TaxID=990650 RepID=A0A0C9VBI7_SPHS4|nr:hypothetical protein M422DRAFT_34937 [Sphaerobolus stellatus SS14]